MKNYLFTALLLGYFITLISSQSGSFDFVDSQGRCWRCTSGSSCVPCPPSMLPPQRLPVDPDDPMDPPRGPLDRLCIPPTPEDCAKNSTLRFPTPDINMFWDCSGNILVPQRCPCDMGFDARQQICVYSNDMRFISCARYNNDRIFDCASTPGPITPAPPTTNNTTASPCVCVPFWPCRCNPCWHMPCRSCNGCWMG